jgi:hypothetical protein
MVFNVPPDPELAKDLAEERQKDMLEEVEAEKLAEEDDTLTDDYKPITDTEEDIIDSRDSNTRVQKD